ncbi:LOW QUALITY PROTEIN: replication protein A 70 kDa DNA-binding subunit-like [Drosophila ficusphila]|uniref:LOW QUALITY PROTEIN: replication protein A 70 kDa DNA-binding subunit-like n=1 Tax=Drosophila ficusphila TaxID=30025 RepID=UPI0007E5FE71|nr:LOW QUALITY PROTEIN: replication protein A 70 kDa DNA-binding subunit-like [Drosophila ficusphila]
MNSTAICPMRYNNLPIRARVTWKSEITPYHNDNKTGKVFLMNLLDESGQITGVVFDDLCDTFYNQIQAGNVYLFSCFEMIRAIKGFKVVDNPHEILFLDNTSVKLCAGVPNIRKIIYNFVPLDKISRTPNLEPVDVIGICAEVHEIDERGGHLIREIELFDDSEANVTLNLWEKEAFNFAGQPGDVILVKGARAQLHNGEMKLNASWYAYVQINPNIREAHELRGWIENY